ncbi:hypothetical protein Pta6605_04430 [Pseudomonas amygdali pv. tabaci]|nr:hypothetical protein Pta6605_04430 [Pseudomonas amygdali pv. tabaci]
MTQCVTQGIPTQSVRNDDPNYPVNPNYRAMLRVACLSGRSVPALDSAALRRFVTQSVTQGIPTREREER